MYRIVLNNGIVAQGGSKLAIAPVLTEKVGCAGTLEYSIPWDDPSYNEYSERLTMASVYDGDADKPIFVGDLLTTSRDFYDTKTVVFEGCLSWLNDVQYPPYDFSGSPTQLFNAVLSHYNSKCAANRRITAGNVTVTDNNNYIARSNQEYSSCYDVLRDKLVELSGGYLCIRYGTGGTIYLDYLKEPGVKSSQKIEFGENLLDLENYIDSKDLATVLIPLGAVKEGSNTGERITIESVAGRKDIVTSLASKYGRIEKTVIWDDVTEPANLHTKAMAYANGMAIMQTITVKVIDLHIVDRSVSEMHVGDMMPCTSAPHSINVEMMLSERVRHLNNPAEDTITLGVTRPTLTGDAILTRKRQQADIASLIKKAAASITPGGGSGGGGMININGPYYPVYSVIDKDITLTFPGIFWEKDDPIVGHVEGVYNGTAEIIANYAPKAGQYYYWRYSKVPEGDGDLVIASDGLYSSGRIDEIKANGDSFWGEDTMKLKYFPKKYPTYTWVNASAPNDGGVFGVWAYYRKPDPDMTAREFSAYLAGKTVTFHLDYFFVFDGPLPGDGIEYFDRLFDHPYDLNLIEMNHSYVLDHENRINEVETGLSNVQDQIKNATVIRNENVQQYDYHSITQNLFNTESSYNRSYYAGGELTGEYIFDLRFDTIPDGYADKIKFIRFDPVGDPTYCGIRYEDGTTYLQIEAWFQNSNKRLVVWAEKSSGLAATFLNTVFNGFHVIYSTEKAETSVTERLASLIAELQTKGLID